MQYTAKFHGCKNVNFQMKNYNTSLLLCDKTRVTSLKDCLHFFSSNYYFINLEFLVGFHIETECAEVMTKLFSNCWAFNRYLICRHKEVLQIVICKLSVF